jgi:glutamyl-tRNA synthetase
MPTTRLAPSSTGALHLGNARTFLVNYLLARRNGWKILLRIEDIDGPRIKKGADQQAIDDLRWLGIDWDEGPVYQTARAPLYAAAIERLVESGHTFRCTCTRKDIETAASAPHAADGAAVYPGTCRDLRLAGDAHTPACLRFRVPGRSVEFTDEFAGPQRFDVARQLGDFVVQKADGTPSYQLAVVVDDADAGVTHIVRGNDLLDSTPRQILLYQALFGAPSAIGNPQSKIGNPFPHYYHLPLVVGPDGRRLAKRHGDTRLSAYRDLGVPASRVLALLARWCGLPGARANAAADLVNAFDLAKMPRDTIVFTNDDDQWLKGHRD